MATTQEVYSLFGLKSPAQVRAERDAQFAQMLEGQSGAGRAGAGVGRLLGGMFRGEDPEAQRYQDFQTLTKGQNLNDPAQLRAMAEGLSNVEGWGEQVQAMRMLADKIEKESRPDVSTFVEYYEVEVPLLDKFGEAVLDPTTKQPIMTTEERRRTRQLKNGELQPYEAPTVGQASTQSTVTPPKPDFIVDAEGGFARANTGDQPVGTGTVLANGDTPVPESTPSAIQTVTPEAASRISMQSGASRANVGPMLDIQTVEPSDTLVKPKPKITATQEKSGIDAISDDAIIARYRALKKKKGRKPSEDIMYKKLESQLLSRGLNEAL